jgi:hypothetical protein
MFVKAAKRMTEFVENLAFWFGREGRVRNGKFSTD